MLTTSRTGTNRLRRAGGFTLVEMTIVMFILAVIVAIATPSFVRHYNASLLDSTARSFVTLSQLARVKAVTHQKPAIVHIDLDRQVFWLTQIGGTNEWGEGGGEQTIHVVEVPERVAVVSAELVEATEMTQTNGTQITFYPNGTCDQVTVVFRGSDPRVGLATTLDPVTTRALTYSVQL